MWGCILTGIAKAITVVMQDAQIMDTVIYGLSNVLKNAPHAVSAQVMLVVQTLINFFIPSGSGQAFATMPIMTPLADVAGVGRQVAVLAFQFGDGFANLILPTNIVLMAILGMAGVPYDRWFRFAWPLMLKLMAGASIALIIAVWIGYA